jgi:O-antigen ligase
MNSFIRNIFFVILAVLSGLFYIAIIVFFKGEYRVNSPVEVLTLFLAIIVFCYYIKIIKDFGGNFLFISIFFIPFFSMILLFIGILFTINIDNDVSSVQEYMFSAVMFLYSLSLLICALVIREVEL